MRRFYALPLVCFLALPLRAHEEGYDIFALAELSPAAAIVEVEKVEKRSAKRRDGKEVSLAFVHLGVKRAVYGKAGGKIVLVVFPPDKPPKAGERALAFLREHDADLEDHGFKSGAGLFAMVDAHAAWIPVKAGSEREDDLSSAAKAAAEAEGDRKKTRALAFAFLSAGKDPLVQRSGARRAAHFGLSKEDVDVVIKALFAEGMDHEARLHLVKSLEWSRDPRAAEAMLKLVRSEPGVELLKKGIGALGWLGKSEEAAALKPQIVAELKKLRGHALKSVRMRADLWLRELGENPEDEPRSALSRSLEGIRVRLTAGPAGLFE